jgi:hypothetical protein
MLPLAPFPHRHSTNQAPGPGAIRRAPDMAGLSYTVSTLIVGRRPNPRNHHSPVCRLGSRSRQRHRHRGPCRQRKPPPDRLARAPETPPRNSSSIILADGPVPKLDILEAADANCITKRTLERAKADLAIVAKKNGPQ